MAKRLNQLTVDELTGRFRKVKSCVLIGSQGMGSHDTYQMRRSLRDKKVRVSVVKNSLARIAFEKAGVQGVEGVWTGPTAVVFDEGTGDPVQLSKAILEWKKKHKQIVIKGGLLDGKFIGPSDVEELSTLPSREELLSQILGLIVGPIQDVANLLNSHLAQVPSLVDAHIEKLEKQGTSQG